MKEQFEFKGTPGLWSYEEDYDKEYVQPTCKINSSYGIEGIATVWSGSNKMTEQCIADAQLISAAPELLEAALDFVNKVDEGRATSTDSYNKFKQAINKALGNET